MAGPTIGRAEIQVDLDGDNIPRQTRALGEAAGLAAGGAFNQRFLASLRKLSAGLRPITDKIAVSLRSFFRRLGPAMIQAGEETGTSVGRGLERSFKKSWANIGRLLGDGLTRYLSPATRDAGIEIEQLGTSINRAFSGDGSRGLDEMSKALVRLGGNSNRTSDDLGDLLERTRSLTPVSRDAGREVDRLGSSMERSFSGNNSRGLQRLSTDVDRLGDSSRESTIDIGEMFQVFDDGADSSDRATDSFNNQSDATRRNNSAWGNLGKTMSDLFGKMKGWTDGLDRHTAATRNGARAADNHSNRSLALTFNLDKLTGAMSRNSAATGGNESSQRSLWKRLSANTRQWILIGSAIAAAGTEIAILGSVAGSSLAVLGTTFLAVGVAAAVGIAAFKGMRGPLEGIEPAARPAAIALKEMGAALGKLQNGIQASLFKDLAGPFNELTAALPKLQDGLNGVAGAVGIVIGSFAKGLASPRGIEVMNKLLGGMQGIIVGLGDVVGNLGSALGTIFVAALPSTNAFVASLSDMTNRFRLFLQSAEGQNALTGFFQTLQTVMPPIVDLLGATGRMLASLVTPDSIARLVELLDNLTEFMPMLGTFLTIVGELNIFGVLAEVLVAFGQAMAPLAPGLMDLAGAVSSTLIYLLQAAVGPLAAVAEAFAPLLDVFTAALTGSNSLGVGVGQLLAVLFGPLSEGFVLLAKVATDFIAVYGTTFGSIFTDLINAIAPVIPIFFEIIGAVVQVAGAFLGPALSGLRPVISVLGTLGEMLAPLGELILTLVGPAETFGKAVADFMVLAMGTFLNLLPSITGFFSSLGPVISAFGDFFVSLGPIISNFVSVLSANLGPILTSIGGLLTALAPVFFSLVTAVLQVGSAFLTALLPSIAPLIDVFTSMLPALAPIATAIGELAPIAAMLGGVLGDYLVTGFQAVADLLPALVSGFGPLLTAVGEIIAVIGPMLVPILAALWDIFVALVPVVLELVTAVLDALLPAFQPLLDIVLDLIPMFTPLLDVIVSLTPVIALLAGMIGEILVTAMDALLPLFPALVQIITDLAPLIPPLAEFIGTALTGAISLLAQLLPPLIELFMSVWGVIQPLLPGLQVLLEAAILPLTFAIELLVPILMFLVDVFVFVLDGILGLIRPLGDGKEAFAQMGDIIDTLKATFKDWGVVAQDVLNNVMNWIRDTAGMIGDFVSNTIGMFSDFFSNTKGMFDDFRAKVDAVLAAVVGYFSALPGRIFAFVVNIAVQIIQFFAPIVAGVSEKVERVVGFFRELPGKIVSFIQGIPGRVTAFFDDIPGSIERVVDKIVGFFTKLPGRVIGAIGNLASKVTSAIGLGNIKLPFTATGGVFNGAQPRIIGEAGPEAVVPLNRPLSQVDPAVRALSAFAQGMGGSGSGVNASRQVYVSPGAIVIHTMANPVLTANAVLDRFVASAV